MSKEILALGVLKSSRQKDKDIVFTHLVFFASTTSHNVTVQSTMLRTPQFDDQSTELFSYSGYPSGLHGSARNFSLPGVVFEMTIRLQ